MRACQLILVEGNISAGKSTLCKSLASSLGFRVFQEPTLHNPYLVDFYANPLKYALPMQIWLLRQRFNTYMEALKYMSETRQGVILDRSIFSDWVFAEKNQQDGNICKDGFAYYTALRNQMLSVIPLPTACVYLDATPAECQYRVHFVRRRNGESGISLDYLEGLSNCYRTFLNNLRAKSVPVMEFDWNVFTEDRVNNLCKDVRLLCEGTSSFMTSEYQKLTPDVVFRAKQAPYAFPPVDSLLVAEGDADIENSPNDSFESQKSSLLNESDGIEMESEDDSVGNESMDELLLDVNSR